MANSASNNNIPLASTSPQTIHSPEVRVVEASAGSGKTYVLAKRYLQLLMEPRVQAAASHAAARQEVPLRTILAITFMNKAAIEMKERILDFLKKIAFDAFSSPQEKEDILSSLSVDRDEARQRAFAIMDEIIRHYNFFQVKTIDSFINTMLLGFANKIGLSANFKIKTDYRAALKYSLDMLIEEAHSDKKTMRLFEVFLQQYLHIEHTAGWLPRDDLLFTLEVLSSYAHIFGKGFRKAEVTVKDLITQKKEILQMAGQLRAALPEGTDGTFSRYFSLFLERERGGLNIEKLYTYFDRETFPVRKGKAVPQDVQRLWDEMREALKIVGESEALGVFNPYIDIWNETMRYFSSIARKEDMIFLAELNHKARQLFDDETLTVAEIYYMLATRFRHYLIDEFQDTSVLQWKNMSRMIEEALSTGGTLFYVGDKKQAIYRFRGGEVALFEQVKTEFGMYTLRPETLKINYRSRKEIVDFNNRIFSEENIRHFLEDISEGDQNNQFLFLSADDREEISSVFGDSTQASLPRNTGGYVKVSTVECASQEERNELIREDVVALVKELKQRFPPEDIAVITRKNDEVQLITSWFLEEGISVESEKTLNIREHALIKEILSLLRFLSSPVDNLSFAAFITGDIFCAASGLTKEKTHGLIFEWGRHSRAQNRPYVYRYFRERYAGVWEDLLEEYFNTVGFIPLYELTVSIMERFQVLERFILDQGFLMRLLELIKEQENEYPSIAEFLEFFDQAEDESLYVKVSDPDSIKILTIHKAKGLEFKAVVLPLLYINVDMSAATKKGKKPYTVYLDEDEIAMVNFKKEHLAFSPVLRAAFASQYKKALIDELNSVYVALTRAKDELHIFVPVKRYKNNKSDNAVERLIPQGECIFGAPADKEAPVSKKERPLWQIPAARYQDWMGLLKEEFLTQEEIKARTKIIDGEIMHYILSCIDDVRHEDLSRGIAEAVEKAAARFSLGDEARRGLAQKAERVLSSEKTREFFGQDDSTAYREKEIVDRFGNTKRIDRMIVSARQVIIVDYKSTRIDSAHHVSQVQEYMNIMREMYPDKTVEGFLLYLDDVSVDQVHG